MRASVLVMALAAALLWFVAGCGGGELAPPAPLSTDPPIPSVCVVPLLTTMLGLVRHPVTGERACSHDHTLDVNEDGHGVTSTACAGLELRDEDGGLWYPEHVHTVEGWRVSTTLGHTHSIRRAPCETAAADAAAAPPPAKRQWRFFPARLPWETP